MQEVNPLDTLGHLTWYTVFDTEITRPVLLDRLTHSGLAAFAPPAIAAADAFRRATHTVERLHAEQEAGRCVNWLVREVRADADQIVRQLVKETVNAAQIRLDYQPLLALMLDKDTGAFVQEALCAHVDAAAYEAAQAAHAAYQRYREVYQGRHLRDLAFRVLKSLNPVSVRPSGGVYFVPGSGTETLRQLQTFMATLSPSQLWTLPVADSGDSRHVITQALGDTVAQTAERVVGDLARLLARQGSVSDREQARAVSEFKRLQTAVAEYQTLLDDRLLSAQAALDAATAQMRTLLASDQGVA